MCNAEQVVENQKIVKKLISLVLIFVFTAIASQIFAERVYSQVEPQTEQVNFQQHFNDLGIRGSTIIYDRNLDRFYQHNPERNQTAFLPASTYKIPNSLIALETGVISSDVDVLTWDGIERGFGGSPYPQWNQDLNLRLAF